MNGLQKVYRSTLVALVAVAAVAACAAPTASASLEFGTAGSNLTRTDGTFSRQAGAHPDLEFNFSFPTEASPPEDGQPSQIPKESVHDVELDLPPGMVGNASAMPTCSVDQLINHWLISNSCPVESQIGTARVHVGGQVPQEPYMAVYNLEHGPETPARFGFKYLAVVATISARVRPSDYGITSGSFNISQTLPVEAAELKIWGVPSDPVHDEERQSETSINGVIEPGPPIPSKAPRVAFLRNPTSCPQSGSPFTVRGDSWQFPGIYDTRLLAADEAGVPYVFEGCEFLGFDPAISARPTSSRADSPTGLDVDFTVPQNESAEGLSPSDVRKTVVKLPPGMTVSPSSADGLGACGMAEVGLGTTAAPSCPESSKIGSVTIATPLLDEELTGDVYLAKQKDNPFGSLLAMYMAVKGPGFYLKLPGRIDAHPRTGQLVTTFADTPQLPFSNLQLNLKSGARAPLTTPRACGTYAIETEVVPWSGTAPVLGKSSFTVDQGCATGGFSPELRAGVANPSAGASSPFTLRVIREDGEQNLAGIETTLPEGLLAKLAGVPLCGDAEAAVADCPPASRIGRTTVGVGAGSNPLYLPQAGKTPTAAYLAGPYEGAPYSLVVKVPAQAGPFDLGTVAVRSAVRIDPLTTEVSVGSDRLPQILEGIPVAYRDVRVEVDKPGFMRNPTNCSPMKVASTLVSDEGASATPAARFQAAGCGELGFKPSLKISLKGKMNRTGNPALKAVLKAPAGQANIAKTAVILPRSQFIDNSHINNPCTRVQFNEGACPAGSVLGTATAYSPLLDKPLSGPVYFRSNGGERELPDLVADLDGQIHVTLVGFIDSVRERVRTRFQNVPDAPVSKFVLKMKGGRSGLIENSLDLCKSPQKATVQMTGQNGKRHNVVRPIATSCRGKKRK